ncbi:hypothetical protein AWW72_00960 [Acinetobacter sp. NRRL B-65365]|uniref:hypothetical protein n=1 Tax=Acinetobacter sp. NRRL B-65365 TaxID=1785092 RepID=UPI0007A06A5C|nr:hypothetical protein [Acinetobacter sp. NRRL B-65365]KYQ85512.1 hypothetical protein AWW72_00960 [Acinetobacter sp. NRRL B-65365]
MEKLSQEKIQKLLKKRFSDIEFELKNDVNPDILTGEVIISLEKFLSKFVNVPLKTPSMKNKKTPSL